MTSIFSFKAILFLSFFISTSKPYEISKMIHDVLTYYGRSKSVTVFIYSLITFRDLSEKGYFTTVLSIDRHFEEIPRNCANFVLDLDCANASHVLNKANSENKFTVKYKWIMFYNHSTTFHQIIEKKFKNLSILVDSDVTIARYHSNSFNFTRIFKYKLNFAFLMENDGKWSPNESLTNAIDEPTASKRRNLMGAILYTCIVITHNDSINHLTDKRDRHIDSIAKVNYVLVEHLSNIVNASLNYSIQTTWGYKDNNSKWSGMIGELTRNEADIGGTPLFLTIDRVDIIEYISMTTPTKSKFVFRQPKLSYVTNVFILPFHYSVWGSIIALLIVVAIVLLIVLKWEESESRVSAGKNIPSELQASWIEVLFFSFGALCQQGASAIPFSVPGRLTTIFLFISFMFLYTSYSANIVALLQSSSTSIQSLEDLLNSRLQVGVDDTVFNHFYFPNATEPIRKAIYERKVAPPGQRPRFLQIEEGIRKMRQGLFAFHVETGAGYKIVSETFHECEKCGLQEIQYLQVPDPWLAIQKNSSFKEMLKIGLFQIQESGIQSREVSLIYTKKPQCISRGSSFISVGLVDCYPAAVVLVGGLIIGFMIFLIELLLHNRKKFLNGVLPHTDPRYPYCN